MYALCKNFVKLFPNVEKTEYYPSADSIRIHGHARTFNDDPHYVADIIPDRAFLTNAGRERDDMWDQYSNYKIIFCHAQKLKVGSFSTGAELTGILHDLFISGDMREYFHNHTDVDAYHQKADEFFKKVLDQLFEHPILSIFAIDYQMQTICVSFTGLKNLWELSMGTYKEYSGKPDTGYILTPYLVAREVDNPVYVHSSSCYAVIAARDLEDLVDKVMHPEKPSDFASLQLCKDAILKQDTADIPDRSIIESPGDAPNTDTSSLSGTDITHQPVSLNQRQSI